jgi:hypothetical protein
MWTDFIIETGLKLSTSFRLMKQVMMANTWMPPPQRSYERMMGNPEEVSSRGGEIKNGILPDGQRKLKRWRGLLLMLLHFVPRVGFEGATRRRWCCCDVGPEESPSGLRL